MKKLAIAAGLIFASSLASATGLDCVKTIVYPSLDGKTPGPTTTHTYRAEMTGNQALINALSPDDNGLNQEGDRFEGLANYSNGQFNPLRIQDLKIQVGSTTQPVYNSSQNTLSVNSADGFTVTFTCSANNNE